jgi:hypothetical protein
MTLFKNINPFRISAYLLFFLLLFAPTDYQPGKAALTVIVVASILIDAFLQKRMTLHPYVTLITVVYSVIGMVFVSIGIIRGNPGALPSVTVYVIWPLLYLIFVMGSARLDVLAGLVRVLAIGAMAISLYTLTYVLHEAHVLPSFLYFNLDLGQEIGFYEGQIKYDLKSISSLLFLVPFLLSALLVWPAELRPQISRRWLWIAFVICVIPVILSGRKALWVIILVAPLFTLMLRYFQPPSTRATNRLLMRNALIGIATAMILLMLYLTRLYNFNFADMASRFAEAFDFKGGTTDDVVLRREQYNAMISAWSSTPLLGTGLGAAAKYSRSIEMPWAYELSYVALLYHTGIVGLMVYASGVVWIYAIAIRIIRTGCRLGQFLLPVMVGTTGFLISNASNPYLEKYDYIWVLFLPIAFINTWLLSRRGIQHEEEIHAGSAHR